MPTWLLDILRLLIAAFVDRGIEHLQSPETATPIGITEEEQAIVDDVAAQVADLLPLPHEGANQ